MNNNNFTYTGIIHVHSTYSDGTKPVKDIVKIARQLDLDFLLLTDHNTMQAKFDGLEGWYDNVLLGVGCELNDAQDRNHYLSFDYDEEIDSEMSKVDYVCKVRDMGGFGIIAHPDENRQHIAKYPPFPWTLWESECYQGIEIWNQMSEWMEGLTNQNKYWRVLHPRRSITTPKEETLTRWDEINMKRKVTGIGGVDAHEHIHKILGLIPFRVFRYKVSFKTIRTHVITPNPLTGKQSQYKKDLDTVYEAIKAARCFISNYYFGDANTFRFTAVSDNDQADMGDRIVNRSQIRLLVVNPGTADTRLICNGRQVQRKTGKEIEFAVKDAGVYRVETHVDNQPWILSNHIRIENES
ncbi:MAG: PHP domain-containing protein [Caldithrix sp.]|nr:PHP domain-containing protein [Caldithrix sp.]